MLRIINNLKPFFKDCYRRISVREYSRIRKISPPTASKFLGEYKKLGLLKKQEERQYFYYFANKDNSIFIDLSRIYWKNKLEEVGLIKKIEQEFLSPVIILFGSLAKAETKQDSDIDIAVFTPTKKSIDLRGFGKKLKRDIQLFIFKNKKEIKNPNLFDNILNGYKIQGSW